LRPPPPCRHSSRLALICWMRSAASCVRQRALNQCRVFLPAAGCGASRGVGIHTQREFRHASASASAPQTSQADSSRPRSANHAAPDYVPLTCFYAVLPNQVTYELRRYQLRLGYNTVPDFLKLYGEFICAAYFSSIFHFSLALPHLLCHYQGCSNTVSFSFTKILRIIYTAF